MKKKAKIAFSKLDLLRNDQLNNKKLVHPTVNDGVMGIKFIFGVKKSSNLNSKWVKI